MRRSIITVGYLGVLGIAVVAEIALGIGMHVLSGCIATYVVAMWRIPSGEPRRKTELRRAFAVGFCVGIFTLAVLAEVHLRLGMPMLAAASAGLVGSVWVKPPGGSQVSPVG